MKKENRLLYIFSLMINGETINRAKLLRKTQVSVRTLRRDIDVINEFFEDFDSPWGGVNTEIKLKDNNNNAFYYLENNTFTSDGYATLGLLLSIKSLTPKLHRSIYELFEQLISNSKTENIKTLKSVLNHFSIREKAYDNIFPGQELMILQKAIATGNMIEFKNKDIEKHMFVTPHSLIYMNYDYWLTYEENNTFYEIKVRNITDLHITKQISKKKSESKELVKFRVQKGISNELKQIYNVKNIRALNNEEAKFVENGCDWLIFEIACTKLDAYYIAYQHASLAQILAPQTYVDSFLDRMKEIFNQYNNTN
ncbi:MULTISPECIES: helix-turn-helix transcriptional regulator [Staphylococcus]|uniref:helix-turn-helix transcriptional regulator n=1 Tax=Staphylococcus TaxID=1279 RepID=UPI000D1F346B|nr:MULTISPECIES: hypothetical protein [Staphylococcus]PTK67843.1 hypothetical protein BUZ28_03425 [Staphylococcus borealis]RIO69448.1 hypothetical protein BUZ17_11590 [Staphylococcus borealis]